MFTELATTLRDNSVLLNQAFNITCNAYANPPAKYRFFIGDESIFNGTTNSGTFTTSVSRRVAQLDYRCIPINAYGAGVDKVITVTVLCKCTVKRLISTSYGSELVRLHV